jgi:hypothetical protein
MLIFSDAEVEPMLASKGILCSMCGERSSPWKAAKKDGIELEPMCGWCVMYAGSAWGHDNRHELLYVGRTTLGIAVKHDKPRPTLDERDRLSPRDAERYMMGIAFTSRMFGGSLKRIERKADGDDA